MMFKDNFKIKRIVDKEILLGDHLQNTVFEYSKNADGSLVFSRIISVRFENFLKYIDSCLPAIISQILPWIYERHNATFEEVYKYLLDLNPLIFKKGFREPYYKHLLSKFASDLVSYDFNDNEFVDENYNLIEIQRDGYFQKLWSLQTMEPTVLMPFCSFKVTPEQISQESVNWGLCNLRLIIQYNK